MPYAICYIPLRRSRALQCTAVLLAVFVIVGFAYVTIMRRVASLLIVEDSLQPAAAITFRGRLDLLVFAKLSFIDSKQVGELLADCDVLGRKITNFSRTL